MVGGVETVSKSGKVMGVETAIRYDKTEQKGLGGRNTAMYSFWKQERCRFGSSFDAARYATWHHGGAELA